MEVVRECVKDLGDSVQTSAAVEWAVNCVWVDIAEGRTFLERQYFDSVCAPRIKRYFSAAGKDVRLGNDDGRGCGILDQSSITPERSTPICSIARTISEASDINRDTMSDVTFVSPNTISEISGDNIMSEESIDSAQILSQVSVRSQMTGSLQSQSVYSLTPAALPNTVGFESLVRQASETNLLEPAENSREGLRETTRRERLIESHLGWETISVEPLSIECVMESVDELVEGEALNSEIRTHESLEMMEETHTQADRRYSLPDTKTVTIAEENLLETEVEDTVESLIDNQPAMENNGVESITERTHRIEGLSTERFEMYETDSSVVDTSHEDTLYEWGDQTFPAAFRLHCNTETEIRTDTPASAAGTMFSISEPRPSPTPSDWTRPSPTPSDWQDVRSDSLCYQSLEDFSSHEG